ncbi:MAG: AAA family ATPase [Rhodobacteraceae bacterium]|nr:AAA family ATPase [Paracoccaceae bacterium]
METETAPAGTIPTSGADESGLRPIPRISIQAFCQSSSTAGVLERASSDRRLNKAHVKGHMGGVAAAVEFYQHAPTPNLIIVECEGSQEKLLADLDSLAEFCDSGTMVIVIGQINDVTLYRELMHRGVSEYLVAPFDVYQLIAAIGRLYNGPETAPLGKVISFFGVKGGCGASTIAHNCAWALAKNLENEVIIADLDLPFGTAGLDFNRDPLQGVYEAVASPERLDETFLDRILSECSEYLTLLAAPASLERTYDHAEATFEGLVDVMRSSSPLVTLDVPHTWNAWTKNVLASADELVLVAEPDLANLRNAKNVVDTFKQLRPNDRPPHLVLNRVGMPKRPEIKPADFATALDLHQHTEIPFDPQLFGTAANNGQMIGEVDAKNPITETFSMLAANVSGKQRLDADKKASLGSLLSKLVRK